MPTGNRGGGPATARYAYRTEEPLRYAAHPSESGRSTIQTAATARNIAPAIQGAMRPATVSATRVACAPLSAHLRRERRPIPKNRGDVARATKAARSTNPVGVGRGTAGKVRTTSRMSATQQ